MNENKQTIDAICEGLPQEPTQDEISKYLRNIDTLGYAQKDGLSRYIVPCRSGGVVVILEDLFRTYSNDKYTSFHYMTEAQKEERKRQEGA